MYHSQYKNPVLKQKAIKADRNLYQRLLVAKEAGRDVDLNEILSHELSPVPLALADISGTMRPTNKAVLGSILQSHGIVEKQIPMATLKTCVIIDGQAVVQAIGKPQNAKNFGQFADRFVGHVFSHLNESCSRVDVVFDRYESHTIKDTTRMSRTKSTKPIRRQVDNRDIPLPVKWRQFIDHPENKQDLEHFLSKELIRQAKLTGTERTIVTSGGYPDRTVVESSQEMDISSLRCNHDEADTRMVLHAKSASYLGFERIIIISRDTDVLALLVHFAGDLSKEIWMQTGTSRHKKFVAVHSIDIDPILRHNLLGFHAISGCDTVSQFCGIGKATAWKTFIKYGCLLDGLGRGVLNVEELADCERFVCRLYSNNETYTNINEIRCKMFKKGAKEPEKLPPTQSSLHLHIKRAHYQCRIWLASCIAQPDIGSPVGNGWNKDDASGNIVPDLMCDEPFPLDYLSLTQCQCKNCESRRCGCRVKGLRCTAGCGCADGTCHNPLNSDQDDSD